MSGKQTDALKFTAMTLGAVALGRLIWRKMTEYDLRNKTVLVTGGSRGLGLVLAREFAREGAQVAICARDEEELEHARIDLANRGAEVMTVKCDVTNASEVESMINEVRGRFGKIDVLVNNAGTIQVGPLEVMNREDFEKAMQAHFWAPLNTMLAVIPEMRERGDGRIVNISSIGGKIATPHLVPYSASKFALAGLSEGLHAELAKYNIAVTTVYPGLMRTGSPVNAMFKGQRPQEYAWFAISDSLPLASISPERAARQIIRACRYGEAELIITAQAKMAVLARIAAPELFLDTMALVNRLLPGPSSSDGDEAKPGRESESDMARPQQPLTAPMYRAAEKNNEM